MKEELKAALAAAISKATALELAAVSRLIEKPKNLDFGDLAFPCFPLGKSWKLPPNACAEKLAKEIKLPAGFSEVIPTGPFLNFRFDRASFTKTVVDTAVNGKITSSAPVGTRSETVILEYSSPNIAKPFHVGHLRATLIGSSLDRIYRHLGYKVITVNHLGDWGTQFGFVWAGCNLWGRPAEATVRDLVDIYRRATSLKENQEKDSVPESEKDLPDINEMARAYFVDLESDKPYAKEFWQWCLDISLKYFKETYQRLGISFDHYTGESFYSDKLDGVRQELERAGILEESKGAFGVQLGDELGFARIYTPDGRSLYLTRDLATAIYRAENFQFDKLIYVVGAPQMLHFKQLFAILKLLGLDYAEKLEHVAFGHVLGIKTRGAGEFIELNDFFDEAVERALKAYHEQVSKRPEGLDEFEVAEAVAFAAIIFSTLSRGRLKDVQFSWDSALEFQGDSGPYLLYACARINGIKEKALTAGISAIKELKPEYFPEESAFNLAAIIDEFPEVLERVVLENEPHGLASFALDLAHAFSKAYNELPVLGETQGAEIAGARLALFEATGLVLRKSIELLGMKGIERM